MNFRKSLCSQEDCSLATGDLSNRPQSPVFAFSFCFDREPAVRPGVQVATDASSAAHGPKQPGKEKTQMHGSHDTGAFLMLLSRFTM